MHRLENFLRRAKLPAMDEIERELIIAADAVHAGRLAVDQRDRAIVAAILAGMPRERIAELAGVGVRRVFRIAADAGAVGPPGRPVGSRDIRPRKRKLQSNGTSDKLAATSS